MTATALPKSAPPPSKFREKPPIEVLKSDENALLDWLADYRSRITNAFKITPKTGGGAIQLIPNEIQDWYLDNCCYSPYQEYELDERGMPISPWTGAAFSFRNLELKPRQVGMSTIVLANKVMRVTSEENRNLLIIAQDESFRDEFRDRTHEYLRQLKAQGECPKFGAAAGGGKLDNKDRLDLANGSTIYFQSALAANIGRTVTYHDVYGTEIAFWDSKQEGNAQKIVHALNSAVPPPPYGTMDFESTANGAAGAFYEMVMASRPNVSYSLGAKAMGEFAWLLFFWEWWRHAEYRQKGVNLGTLTTEEKDLMARHGLDYEQIAWRRAQKRQAEVLKLLFESEYPEDVVQCFVSGRDTVIPAQTIFRMRDFAEKHEPARLEMEGDLRVFEGPEPGVEYVIGADGAEGIPGKDQSAFVVVRRDTMEPVVLYNGPMGSHDLARVIARYGYEYNVAYVAAESNNNVGYALNSQLEALNYPNLHYRENPERDQRTAVINPFALGWHTNVKTRGEMIELLKEYLIGTLVLIRDKVLVDQVSTFIWRAPESNPSGALRPEAAPGAKDDLLFAYMITLAVRDYASSGARRAAPVRY